MMKLTISTDRSRPRDAAGQQGGMAILLHEALSRTRQHEAE
jgi:hypothetical protein